MPTFSTASITTDFETGTDSFGSRRFKFVRSNLGRVFCVYAESTGRYVRARYSDDNGATWSAAEQVWDRGSTSATTAGAGICFGAVAGQPAVWIIDSTTMRTFLRNSDGTWTAKATQAVQSSQETGKLLQTPDGNWHLFYYNVPGGIETLQHLRSTNGMTSFSAYKTTAPSNSSVGSRPAYIDGAFDIQMDSAGNLHMVTGLSNGTQYALFYSKFTYATETWASGEQILDTGTVGTQEYHPALVTVAIDDNDKPHVGANYRSAATATHYQFWYTNRVSGSWLTPEKPYGADKTTGSQFGAFIGAHSDGTPYAVFAGKGYGTNTGNDNVQYYTRDGGGSWTRWAVTDAASNYLVHGIVHGSGGGRAATGVLAVYSLTTTLTAALSSDFASSANLPVSASSGFSLSSVASPREWLTRTITSSTVTQIPGGGRQIVRTSAGVLWHCYYEGGQLKAAYSSDEGQTWTITVVGPSWSPAGLCMCVGAGDEPVLIATRPGNDDFYIYQWSGASWVLKKQLNEPIAESRSFQIAYTGSTYLFIYGFVTSSGDRHVKSRTSSDLITWSSATAVKNGDSSGTGAHVFRRVAMCLDASGNGHAVYSIRSGGNHKLFYRKYSGGAWGTEETLLTGGTGNNLSDYQSGLSIAVDDLGQVHVVASVQDSTYTSRVKLTYLQRSVAGVWTSENVHSTADGDQLYPSLSLNGRRPLICWASQGLALSVVRALRATDGSAWSFSIITTETRDGVHSVHGPEYGSRYYYTRGAVGSMRGSEEYFASFDALSGSQAFAESYFSLGGDAHTLQRIASTGFTLGGVAGGVNSRGAQSTFNLSVQANLTYEREASSTFNLHQIPPTGTVGVLAIHTLNFSGSATGVKDQAKSVTHTLNFTQSVSLTWERITSSGFSLSGVALANVHKQVAASTGFSLGTAPLANWVLGKPVTSSFSFSQGATGLIAEGCDTGFEPDPPLPDEDAILTTYLQGPWDTLLYSVQLRRPEFGNVRENELQVYVEHTRGGDRRTFARTNTYERISLSWIQLSRKKLLEVRRFLRLTKGQDVRYTDENGHVWRGVIVTSNVPLDTVDRDQGGRFEIVLEGEVVGP